MATIVHGLRFADGTHYLRVNQLHNGIYAVEMGGDPDGEVGVLLTPDDWAVLSRLDYICDEHYRDDDDDCPGDTFRTTDFIDENYTLTIAERGDRTTIGVSIRDNGSHPDENTPSITLNRDQWLYLMRFEYRRPTPRPTLVQG